MPSRRTVLRWLLLLLPPGCLGRRSYAYLPPTPRWSVAEPLSVYAVRPEGVLLHGIKDELPVGPLVLSDAATGAVRQRFFPEGIRLIEMTLGGQGPLVAAWIDRADQSELRIADLCGGTERVLFSGPSPERREFRFAPDGQRLAVCRATRLELWDAGSGTLLAVPFEGSKEVPFVGELAGAFTPDGAHYLTATRPEDDAALPYLKAWSLREQRWAYALKPPAPPPALPEAASAPLPDAPGLKISPDGRWLVEARFIADHEAGEAYHWTVWNLVRREPVIRSKAGGTLPDFRFLGDGRSLACIEAEEDRLEIWDMEQGRCTMRLDTKVVHAGVKLPCQGIQFAPDGRSLLTTHGFVHIYGYGPPVKEITVRLYDTAARLLCQYSHLPSYSQILPSASFTPDARTVVLTAEALRRADGVTFWQADATAAAQAQTVVVATSTGSEQTRIPLWQGLDNAWFHQQQLSPDGRLCMVHGFCMAPFPGLATSPWRAWVERWLPFIPIFRHADQGNLLSVIELRSQREVFHRVDPDEVDVRWNADGLSLLTRTPSEQRLVWPGDTSRLTPLRCYDIPARTPWLWVFGPSVLLLVVLIGVARWLRKGKRLRAGAGGANSLVLTPKSFGEPGA